MNADPMVRESQVRNVRGRTRHMTMDAIVVGAFLLALGRADRTALGLMTIQANGLVIRCALFGRRLAVRVVAGQTGQRFRTLIATAPMHLLDMADYGHRPVRPLEAVNV